MSEPVCAVCSHPKSSHGDDKAPQWERPCWWMINGARCPCTGYVPLAPPLPATAAEGVLREAATGFLIAVDNALLDSREMPLEDWWLGLDAAADRFRAALAASEPPARVPATAAEGLREALAALEHHQWMTWARSLMDNENLTAARVGRWESLMVPYDELAESDKDHDREWADKVLVALAASEPPAREDEPRG